ncbi:MAG: type I restriction enzyme HsdR N-terminal domain-containing protein [Desulfonatronovibrionaceae bacterium]
MHEVSLNQVITDYITGKEIEMTTYEDLRQAIARLLVEEKGYPARSIIPKYPLELDLGDKKYSISIDFVIFKDRLPVLITAFCPGAVSTYITQYIALARLFPETSVPYVVVTDSKDAVLMETATRKEICRGYHCIPDWEELSRLAAQAPAPVLSRTRLEKEKRIAYAMFALSDGCCTSDCSIRKVVPE